METDSLNGEHLLDEGDEDSELVFDASSFDMGTEDLNIDCNDLALEGDHLEVSCDNIDLTEDDNCELESDLLEREGNDYENCSDRTLNLGHDEQDDEIHEANYLPPTVGKAFDSYEEAYNYYNCYAKDLGFAIRVKSSWTKRNSKEKRGAVLCCNCEGFKTLKEANTRRKETRTGCLAMIRLRLTEYNKWRVEEAKFDHNHSFDRERAQNSKSHKKTYRGKRKVDHAVEVQVKTIKLYRTVYPSAYGNSNDVESNVQMGTSKCLKCSKGDIKAIHDYFSRAQLKSPNFLHLMDFNDDGFLRNVFWIYPRSRASYRYFNDVIILHSTCLSAKHEVPFIAFAGWNHHGKPILLGSGLLADQSQDNYVWLLRVWLTCMSGCPPQTIISDDCKALQRAISEVFPRVCYRVNAFCVLRSICNRLREMMIDFEAFQMALNSAAYDSSKVDEFELAWEKMTREFGVADNKFLQEIYNLRDRWAPVYSKETIFPVQKSDFMTLFFDNKVKRPTSLTEFFHIHDSALRESHRKEEEDDSESQDWNPFMRTNSYYELQLSRVFTAAIFRKFQGEVVRMASCFSITQTQPATFTIQEQASATMVKDFEVTYDKATSEVRCACNCFNRNGYLCGHALYLLNHQGVEELPYQYILLRWRKDFKRVYGSNPGSNAIDVSNPVQWFDHLHRRAMEIVERGMASQDHYDVARQLFKQSLEKILLISDKPAS